MSKLTVFEIVISALSAIVSAAKSILKFIGYIGKLRPALAEST